MYGTCIDHLNCSLYNVYLSLLLYHSAELDQGIATGIALISKLSNSKYDLISSSKCATDGNGNIMHNEDTRKIRSKHDTFVVDDQGRNLDLTKIKYSAVNSYKEAAEAYEQHDYARDGPTIISCQTSRETDQDSAWEQEMNHQEHCTKNDIKSQEPY